MNRRTFLTTLTAAAAGFALDPEQLLWVPGRKTIFLPPLRPAVVGVIPCRFIFWHHKGDEPFEHVMLEGDEASQAWDRWDNAVKLIGKDLYRPVKILV